MVKFFERIEVRDADGKVIDLRNYDVDVEYIEQVEVPTNYLQNFFSELWQTGKFSFNDIAEIRQNTQVIGVYYGEEFYLGRPWDYAIDIH